MYFSQHDIHRIVYVRCYCELQFIAFCHCQKSSPVYELWNYIKNVMQELSKHMIFILFPKQLKSKIIISENCYIFPYHIFAHAVKNALSKENKKNLY